LGANKGRGADVHANRTSLCGNTKVFHRRHLELDGSKGLFLSQYLHDLGVFLHFQKDILLKDTVILQNELATPAVFRVLDEEAVKEKLGRFGEEDCARLWKDSAYAPKHPELAALMNKFELA